jgi:hypothetical protein
VARLLVSTVRENSDLRANRLEYDPSSAATTGKERGLALLLPQASEPADLSGYMFHESSRLEL